MELKLSRKGIKKRSFRFSLGLQKPTFNFPPEDPNRYYDFKDTPLNWRPASPLIDRQEISAELESHIRDACAILFHSIEQGEPLRYSFPAGQVASDVAPELNDTVTETPERVEPRTEGLYTNPEPDTPSQNEKLDSGFELEAQRADDHAKESQNNVDTKDDIPVQRSRAGSGELAIEIDISQFYDQPNKPDDATYGSSTTAEVQPLHGAAESYPNHKISCDVHASLSSQLQLETQFSAGDESQATPPLDALVASPSDLACPPTPKFFSDTASEEIEVFLNPDGFLPCRTPSFSRPLDGSRLARKECFDDLQLGPRGEVRKSFVVPSEGPLCGLHLNGVEPDGCCDRNPDRPSTAIGLGTSEVLETKSGAVIIDSEGLVHVMTAAEESRRRIDLQRAVLEKMLTGMIGGNSDGSAMAGEEAQRQTDLNRAVMEKMSTGVIGGNYQRFTSISGPNARQTQYETKPSSPRLSPPRSPHLVGGKDGVSNTPKVKPKHSLMRKLSVFGLGKKRSSSAPRNGDMVGFSRLAEAA